MERVRRGRGVLEPTLSQSSRSRSTRILISSGMAKEGCVSLSWMATCCGGGGGRQRISLGSKPRLWLLSFAPSESPPRAWHGCRAELAMEALMGAAVGQSEEGSPGFVAVD